MLSLDQDSEWVRILAHEEWFFHPLVPSTEHVLRMVAKKSRSSFIINPTCNTHSLSIVAFPLYLYRSVHYHSDHHEYSELEYNKVRIYIRFD